MLRDIISLFATCEIFWAPDFINWREAVDQMYPTSIDKISNYGVFQGFSLDPISVKPSELWNLK